MVQFHPVAVRFQELITLANEIERELVRLLGINLTDYRALTVLAGAGSLTVGALAEKLGASAATTTAICNRLEERGYLSRERTGTDRRRVLVSTTPEAFQRIFELMGPLMRQTNDHVLTLPDGDRAVVDQFSTHVLGLLRDHLGTLAALDAAEHDNDRRSDD